MKFWKWASTKYQLKTREMFVAWWMYCYNTHWFLHKHDYQILLFKWSNFLHLCVSGMGNVTRMCIIKCTEQWHSRPKKHVQNSLCTLNYVYPFAWHNNYGEHNSYLCMWLVLFNTYSNNIVWILKGQMVHLL
jgi:hypothetical protein